MRWSERHTPSQRRRKRRLRLAGWRHYGPPPVEHKLVQQKPRVCNSFLCRLLLAPRHYNNYFQYEHNGKRRKEDRGVLDDAEAASKKSQPPANEKKPREQDRNGD